MSYAQRKANWVYGIQCYLSKRGFDISGRGKKLNDFMVDFLKSKGLPYEKWNPRYKGCNTAAQINSELVQEHFSDFKKYVETIKNIDNLVFENVDPKDYPDFSDAFIVSANCNGKPMTESEIEKLDIGDFYDELFQSTITT